MAEATPRRSHDHGDSRRGDGVKTHDDPPNSRLFIVCGKSLKESDFWNAFSPFGTIEEVWIVKDRHSGDPKGVTYVKFSKTSEAAKAMEDMQGKCIGKSDRPLKVLVAHTRDQGSRRDPNEDERLLRLFVVVPRQVSETDMKEHFESFGNLDYCSVIKDKNTKESKGFGYVKYKKMYNAALAFENCDRSYKPVFADPKPQISPKDGRDGRGVGALELFSGSSGSITAAHPFSSQGGAPHLPTPLLLPSPICDGFQQLNRQGDMTGTKLMVIASPSLNQDQLWKLFDLVPGLDYCDLWKKPLQAKVNALVVYNNAQSAAYALQKLHGFEYPPGERLIVKYDSGSGVPLDLPGVGPLPAGSGGYLPPSLGNGVSSPVMRDRAVNPAYVAEHDTKYDPSYCSIGLPPPQPLAPIDALCVSRLFIVTTPAPPPTYILKDVFGRMGSLIDVYMLHGKNCGYVKYASANSAEMAIETLHGQEVCGSRLKVMPADPRSNDSGGGTERKRAKIHHSDDA